MLLAMQASTNPMVSNIAVQKSRQDDINGTCWQPHMEEGVLSDCNDLPMDRRSS